MSPRSTDHPSEAALEALARGPGAEEAPERRHLEAGCAHCATRLRSGLGRAMPRWNRLVARVFLAGEGGSPEERRELARRTLAWRTLGRAERGSAPELLEALLALPLAERREAVRRSRRYASRGLALHLVDAARAAGFRDPARALDLADLAVEVAEVLEGAGFPRRIAADAQALAWGAVANAHRIPGELVEAERAMRLARRFLSQGTGDPGARAEVLSLLGSLRIDEARFDEAVAVLEEAAGIHRAHGQGVEEGKVLVKLGNAAGERGDAGAAARFLERARERLAGDAHGELGLIAAVGLIEWTRAAGRTEEARQVLEELEAECRDRELTFSLGQRIAWAGARLAWAEGDLERAESELLAVRRRYGDNEEAYRYCLLSLDLATLYLEQGRTAEVRELAREMVPVFASRQIHRHGLQALVVFQGAAEAETATAAGVEEISRYLRHAANNPYLAYPGAA